MHWINPRRWASLLALVVLTCSLSLAQAQLFTVTVAGVDNLMESVKYGMKMAGKEDMAAQIDYLLEAFLQNKGFEGLDTKKPMGAYLNKFPTNHEKPPVVVFIPISNEEEFIAFLGRLNVNPGKAENGVRSITLPIGQTVYLKIKNSYAFVSMDEEELKNASEPVKIAGKLPVNALFHVHVGLSEIPDSLKDQFLTKMNEEINKEAAKKENEPEIEYKARQATIRISRQAIERLVKDAEAINITASLDKQSHQFSIESNMQPKAGSGLHQEIKAMNDSKSIFASLFDNSPGYFVAHGIINQSLRSDVDALIDGIVKKAIADEKSIVKKAIAEKVFQALEPTLKSKNYEFALSMRNQGDKQPMTGVAAIQVKDGKKIEELIKGFVVEMKEKERAAIKLDVENVKGVNLHVITVPADDKGAKDMEEAFGEAKITIAIHNDYIIAAIGKNGTEEVKKFLNGASASTSPAPVQLQVNVKPFTRFVKEAPIRGAIEKVFSAPNSDQIKMSVTGGDKVNVKFVISTHFLKLAFAVDEAKGQ